MSLLSDDEILSASQDHFAKIANVRDDDVEWDKWAKDFARAVEAAILAKLASAELPEPTEIIDIDGFSNEVYDSYDLREIFKQGFAQGAASQLSAVHVATVTDNFASDYSEIGRTYQAPIAIGTRLFTLKEPK